MPNSSCSIIVFSLRKRPPSITYTRKAPGTYLCLGGFLFIAFLAFYSVSCNWKLRPTFMLFVG